MSWPGVGMGAEGRGQRSCARGCDCTAQRQDHASLASSNSSIRRIGCVCDCDTPHGTIYQRVASADFFSACLQTLRKLPKWPVNTPQRPMSRRSSCYQEWSSLLSLPIRRASSSDLVAHFELHSRGCCCPRGLSPSENAGICFCDPTPQLSQPVSPHHSCEMSSMHRRHRT